jgi:peptidoglycan LD-endopeptidase LytH
VRAVRLSLAVAVLLATAIFGLPAEPAGASQADLDRAQKRANQAAADLVDVQTRLSQLQAETITLRSKNEANAARLGALKSSVRDVAIGQYVSGHLALSNVGFSADLSETARNQVLSKYVAESTDDELDEYRQISEDLERSQKQLDDKQKQTSAAAADMRRKVSAANAELQRLTKLEEERKAAEARRRAAEAAKARARPASAPASKASSSSAPARSGGSFAATGDWMCPVQGARSFGNDWGNPRGGGSRRHQGTDILSPRGTPVVAPVSGNIHRNDSSNGGISFYLTGVDGIEYFGAHLESYVGGSGGVSQGQIVGYVGNSGNARGGPPHLHFEIHPGGGGAVNPYPTVAKYC